MSITPSQIPEHLAVRAAYLRMCGKPQAEVAQTVSRTERTIRSWENSDWWNDAVEEARDRWLDDVMREARAALYLQLKKARDPVRAMQVLERMDPEFRPPTQQLEHSGEVDTGGETHIYLPDNDRDQVPEAIRQRQESLKNGDKR